MPGRTHLLVAPSSGAAGEMAVGLRLAWQLHAAGDRVLFLASKVHAGQLRGTPFPHGLLDGLVGRLPEILPYAVADKRADDVVLVDLTAVLMASTLHGLDVGFLARQRVPVVALDLWSLGETSLVLDAGGGELRLPRAGLEAVPRRLVVAPYARPSAPGACDFWPEGGAVDAAAARAAWAPDAERLVVMVTSLWQTSGLPVTPAMAAVPARLAETLAGLPAGLRVLHVGPRPVDAAALGSRYRHLPPLAPPRFRELVAAADVLLTLNQLPTTASVALDLGVPVLTVIGRDPAFRVWPAGFNRFFGEVLDRNPFASLIRGVAIEDGDELRDAVWQPRLDRAGLAAYRAEIAALPRAADRLAQLLD